MSSGHSRGKEFRFWFTYLWFSNCPENSRFFCLKLIPGLPISYLPPLPLPPIPKQVKKMRRDDCFDRILSYANTLTYRKFAVTCVFRVYHYRVISKDFSGTIKSFWLACSFTLFLRHLRGCSYSICQREMNVNDLKIAALCQVNYWFILLPA